MRFLALLALCLVLTSLRGEGLPANPGFEEGFAGWGKLWTREGGEGTATLDAADPHGGKTSLRVDHRGALDWSVDAADSVAVVSGNLVEISAWVKLVPQEGESASLTLAVATFDGAGKVRQWNYGQRTTTGASGWTLLKSRFLVPEGVAKVRLRFLGSGAARAWLDDVSFSKTEGIAGAKAPAPVTASNPVLRIVLDPATGGFAATDLRTGETVSQAKAEDVVVLSAKAEDARTLRWSLLHLPSGLPVEAVLRLDPSRPEATLELSADGDLPEALKYPAPFLSKPGEYLVLPMNEGISYPVDDSGVEPQRLVAYGGHGICMAFWGATDGVLGHMAILETPDDAAVRVERREGRLDVAPEWDAQKGRFGYVRRLRYVFLDRGGHVAMAKRYRAYAKEIGLFRTLEEKRKANPNVDLLVGAANVWCWDRDPVPIVNAMRAEGIDRILWSNGQSAETLRVLNGLGVLTSRYDLYQDIMDPAQYPRLAYVHPDWSPAAWPDDLVRKADGDWVRGWEIETKDGGRIACGVLSDVRALPYAKARIPAELAEKPYRCRFIDTTTASPWREDYSPAHPMSRTECRRARMELLDYVSGACRLVTGSETGHDAAVPFVDYFEGMLSLGPYRVPDSGRHMQQIVDPPPEAVAKFQTGQAYRLPLWELVYHDCVVAQWYWGDYNNKLPALWDKRDLFNALYGTPPMFMFDKAGWERDKARFAQSYRATAPIARATGYSEMTDHRFLTADRNVQQTAFADGTVVTANFGGEPFALPDGSTVPPLGLRVTGPGATTK